MSFTWLQVPSDEAQRVALGYNFYHCYNNGYLVDAASYLALDAAYGIESAVIMWGCKRLLTPFFSPLPASQSPMQVHVHLYWHTMWVRGIPLHIGAP